MIAAEKGNLNAVKYFLNHKADESYEVGGKIAIDLVDVNAEHYSDIIMSLLNENSRFPKHFDKGNASDDLKFFLNDMESMHKSIKEGNIEEVQRIIKKNQNLRYFFVPSKRAISISAYKTAEKCNQTQIMKLLRDNAIILASFEIRRSRSASDGMSTLKRIKNSLERPLKRGYSTPTDSKKGSKDIDGTPLRSIKETNGEGEKENKTFQQNENEELNSVTFRSNSDESNLNRSQSNGEKDNEENFLGRARNFLRSPVSFFARRHRKEQDRVVGHASQNTA